MMSGRNGRDEGAAVASAIRALAHDAHRMLASHAGESPAADPDEVAALLRRAARLRSQLRAGRSDDLRRWLENLQRRLERLRRHATIPTPCTVA
jgi:hypothetical protein